MATPPPKPPRTRARKTDAPIERVASAGAATGDTKLQAEGKADKAKGAAHNAAGDVKDAAKDARHAVKH